MLAKYEWFKNQKAAIDKTRADIMLYEEQYKLIDKDDRQERNQSRAELMGIVSTYNSLCAEYNAQMSKFNYRFTNKGDLPQTNLEPLPREIAPYKTSLQ
jgi:hypothetical protein